MRFIGYLGLILLLFLTLVPATANAQGG